MNRLLLVISFSVSTMVCAVAFADENRVAWPENYATHFVRYHSVDKPKVDKPAIIRFFSVNTEALTRAKSGEPLPNGTILIMEDRNIVLDDDGNPMTDKQGRFIPTNEILSVIIQQKKAGWGNEYSEEIRNGDWEYAVFFADGTRKNNIEYDKCFACHKMQAEADYNFTFSPFLARLKPCGKPGGRSRACRQILHA